MKFVTVAGAAAMLLSSTAASATSPLDQRPSQLQVSSRAKSDLKGASSLSPAAIILLLLALTAAGFGVNELLEDNTSPG